MAEHSAVWGIDIGQAGLKAIRLRYAEAAGQAIAVAFDYVPHPKILSQPDAVPDELIAQALQTFLSRNETKGDLLAISVPGQTALARFIQLPPVDAKKVVEIVRYEARQQIPFALEDVIWDFQTLGSGSEEGDYLIDAEVGLFAMKRDQVLNHLRPFTEARCEVELIQIAPLALYNFLCYDRMGIRLGEADEKEHEYEIVLDMGADNTTLLVSNGKKIWIRNVPIGGNHFTRALTKEMKLTFAKAEHLKCNATKSPDPKAVFQALRPVFNDYVAEIQRSIGYFSSVNRDAKIQRIMGVGNGFKLAGLQKFLHQNLQFEVERVESFSALVGDAVLNVPLFQENIMTFVVPYGLALQGLKLTRIRTSLLPAEIKTARMIQRKKPWAIAAAATLLVGLSTSTLGYAYVNSTTSKPRWQASEDEVDKVAGQAGSLKTAYEAEESKNKALRDKGNFLVSTTDGRTHWLEVFKAINECLPRDSGDNLDTEDIQKRNRIRIHSITTVKVDDLKTWFDALPTKNYMPEADKNAPPTGPGYVFTLRGLHYHDDKGSGQNNSGVLYVDNTLIRNLSQWEVKQPDSPVAVPVRKIGISHPVVLWSNPHPVEYWPYGRPNEVGGAGGPAGLIRPNMARPSMTRKIKTKKGAKVEAETDGDQKMVQIAQTDFELSFVWKETPASLRTEAPPVVAGSNATPGNATPAMPHGNATPGNATPGNATPGNIAAPPAPAGVAPPPTTTTPAGASPATTPAGAPAGHAAPNAAPSGAATPAAAPAGHATPAAAPPP